MLFYNAMNSVLTTPTEPLPNEALAQLRITECTEQADIELVVGLLDQHHYLKAPQRQKRQLMQMVLRVI